MWIESAKMVTAVQRGQDRRVKSPFLIKKDDSGVPSIECTINGYSFQKTLYDTGSDDNIMAAVTYHLLHGTMPLQPAYIQLQMIFRSLTWEKTSMIHLPSLEDRSSNTIKAIFYIGTGEAHMHFPSEKVRHYFNDSNYIVEDSKQVKTRRRRRN